MSNVRDRLANMRTEILTNPAQARHDLADLAAALEGAASKGEAGRSDWLDLAECFCDLSDFSGSIEIMERVLKTYGADPMVSFKIVTVMKLRRNRRDLPQLQPKLRELLPSLPLDKNTLPELIRFLWTVDVDELRQKEARRREIRRYDDKWIQIDCDNPQAWMDVTHRSLQMALKGFHKGLRPVGYATAMLRRARRHLKGARRALQGTYAADPRLWSQLHQLQTSAGMMAESVESAGVFFRLSPQNHHAMFRILELHPKFPNIVTPDEFDQILARLLARERELAPYWRDLAMLCGGAGRTAEKRVAIERCLALEPNDQFARTELRFLDFKPGNEVTTKPGEPGKTATKSKWWRRLFAKQADRG